MRASGVLRCDDHPHKSRKTLKSLVQKSIPVRIQHGEAAADHKPRQIIQPVSICVFRVHHLISALKFSSLIPPADGCGRVDVSAVYQMCNAFPVRDSSQKQAVKTSARRC